MTKQTTTSDIPDGMDLTPFNPQFRDDPYPIFERVRSLDPVHRDVQSFYPNSWTIASHEHVSACLKDERLSVDCRKVGLVRDPRADNAVTRAEPDMMTLDNPDHQRLRHTVQRSFTPARISRRADDIRDTSRALLAGQIGRFDVVEVLAKPLPTIVIANFLGVDAGDHPTFKAWTEDLLLQGYPQPTAEQWDRIVAASDAIASYMGAAMAERGQRPGEDFLSDLCAADKLSEKEKLRMATLLIGAGNFTTTDLIGNTLYAWLRFGGVPSPRFVDEVLRFDSPSLSVRRFATADVTLDDRTMIKGSVVNLLLAAANHDPAVFRTPARFDAERPPQEAAKHLAFGGGSHHCLGARLASLQAHIALDVFVDMFPNAKLESVTHNKTLGFRGCRSLIVQT